MGVDTDGVIYILDLWREQTESDKWVESFLDLVEQWQPLTWAEEQGQILKSVGPFLRKRMMERRIFCHREQFTSANDKPTRARAIQGRMATEPWGLVRFPRNSAWWPTMRDELLSFPNGKNDDMVDALSLIGRMMAGMISAKEPDKAEEPRHVQVVGGDYGPSLPGVTMDDLWADSRKKRRR